MVERHFQICKFSENSLPMYELLFYKIEGVTQETKTGSNQKTGNSTHNKGDTILSSNPAPWHLPKGVENSMSTQKPVHGCLQLLC